MTGCREWSRLRSGSPVASGRSSSLDAFGVGTKNVESRRLRWPRSFGAAHRSAPRPAPVEQVDVRRALAFLTVVGGLGDAGSRSTVAWFPVVGALVGLAVGGAWWAADAVWSRAIAAAVFVAIDLGLTGMLHLDGLVDAADGVLPHLERERRLAVMSEPTIGAFGLGAAVAVLLLRFASVASMGRDVLLIGGLWCVSRTIMAVAVRVLPYGRPGGGLASSFQGKPGGWAVPAGDRRGARRRAGRGRRRGPRCRRRRPPRCWRGSPSWPWASAASAGTPATCSEPRVSSPRPSASSSPPATGDRGPPSDHLRHRQHVGPRRAAGNSRPPAWPANRSVTPSPTSMCWPRPIASPR